MTGVALRQGQAVAATPRAAALRQHGGQEEQEDRR